MKLEIDGFVLTLAAMRSHLVSPTTSLSSLQANLVQNNQWNVKSLIAATSYGITSDTIAAYYKFAKFNFDCGDYQQGRDMLENYISLFASPPKQTKEGEDEDDDDELTGGAAAKSSPAEDEKTGNPNM